MTIKEEIAKIRGEQNKHWDSHNRYENLEFRIRDIQNNKCPHANTKFIKHVSDYHGGSGDTHERCLDCGVLLIT